MSLETKLKPGQRLDRFEIDILAGRGGMGEVYRARDTKTNEIVAIKILRKIDHEADDSLQRESFVLSSIEHPNIVRFVASGESPFGPYLAMEWVEGEKLSKRLQQGPLGISESIQLISHIADALSVAHRRGLVHCDIKPGNLFLPSNDIRKVKILDFGLAHQQSALQSLSQSSGRIAGTPAYMAPEQARGQSSQLNPRADIFSLGCVFFECIAGQPTFAGKHMTAVLAKILFEEAPELSRLRSGVPKEVEALIRRMLSKDANLRPRDGGELAMLLRDVGGTQDTNIKISLTQQEQQLISVILAVSSLRESDTELLTKFRDVAKRFGGRAETLADGSVVAMLWGQQAATDLARQAARCALLFRELLPLVPIAVTTGRGEAGPWPVGEAIERAVALARSEQKRLQRDQGIRLDDATTGLLDERFVVKEKLLYSESEVWEETRTLLGKVAPFVGREDEQEAIFQMLSERLFDKNMRAPQGVWVLANAGVGKSRLSRALLEQVKREKRPVSVWLSRGELLRQSSPFGLLVPTLRRIFELHEGEPALIHQAKLSVYLKNRLGANAEDAPDVIDFMGELLGLPPAQESPAMRAAKQDPRLMSERLLSSFLRFVSAEIEAKPVLWVIEDLHWGDLATAQFISAALKANTAKPFFVLSLARPEVETRYGSLWDGISRETFALETLSKKASYALARYILGDDFSDAMISSICERAGGNAFYLEELIRAAADGESAFPETVLAMAQNRLQGLPAKARLVLRAASIFGQDFWEGGISLLSTLERSEVKELLQFLIRQEFILRRQESRFSGEIEYTFRHALMREAAGASLTTQDKTLGHRLAGQWLEQNGEKTNGLLAEHFEMGQAPEVALRFYALAAKDAMEANDLESALSYADKALACHASGETRGELSLLKAEVYNWKAEFAKAKDVSLEATQLLPRGSELWFRATSELILAYRRMNQFEPVIALAAAIQSTRWPLEQGTSAIIAATRAVTGLAFAQQIKAATELCERIGETSKDLVDEPYAVAWYEMVVGGLAMLRYDIGGFLHHSIEAMELFAKVGDKRNVCSQRMDVGYTWSDLGFHQKAVDTLYYTMEEAVPLALHRIPTGCRRPLCISLAHLGRFDDARREARLAIEEFSKQGDLYQESGVRIYLARIEMMQGNIAAAEEQVQLVLASLPPGAASRPAAMAAAAKLALMKGQNEDAVDFINVAIQKFKPLGGINVGESFIRFTYSEVMLDTAAPEIAKAAVLSSYQNITERANKIVDPECRESFLKNLPENAGIRALAARLGLT
jgi:tetratricopeptide (TPR) repeat protein